MIKSKVVGLVESENKTQLQIKYQYSVNKETFEGHKIHLLYGSKSKESALERMYKYLEGSRVSIFYNPKKLKDSYLETNCPVELVVSFGLGGIVFIIAGIGLFLELI